MSYFSQFQPSGLPIDVSYRTSLGQFQITSAVSEPKLTSPCGRTHATGCTDDNNRGQCHKDEGHFGEHNCGKCHRTFT